MEPATIKFWLVLAALALAAWLFRRWRRRHPLVPTPFADFPVRMAQVGDWRIRYHMSGRGPAVVLLHGIGANLFCWRQLVLLLSGRFTAVAMDLPGFGQSSKPADAHYGLDEQVERLRGFFKELGLSQFYLVGNSMGGNIALWYALRHPDQVMATAVIAPATSPELIPLSTKRWLWLSRPISFMLTRGAMRWAHGRTVTRKHLVDGDRVEETYKTYGGRHEAVRSFLLAAEAIRDPRLARELRELRSPTLILWGSEDKLVSRQVIDGLESALPAAFSDVHIGGGHHLQEDDPHWVAEKIEAFFARITG
jgi:pimeloyl-ACP methyl ester carboxylesterase